jgi:hypothetical protein
VRVAKSAFAASESGIAFTIDNDDLYETGMVMHVTATDVSAEDLTTAPPTPEERGERAEARQFLTEILAEGPVESGDVAAAARAAGISERTHERARGDLRVVSERERAPGTGRTAKWRLRRHALALLAEIPEDAPPAVREGLARRRLIRHHQPMT